MQQATHQYPTETTQFSWGSVQDSAATYYRASPMERVTILRERVPAKYLTTVLSATGLSKTVLYQSLGFARATLDRKLRHNQALSASESERLMGLVRLIGQAQTMVQESGDPTHFDAAKWVAAWLCQPHPALGGRCAIDFLDTATGQNMIANLLAQQSSGAYA